MEQPEEPSHEERLSGEAPGKETQDIDELICAICGKAQHDETPHEEESSIYLEYVRPCLKGIYTVGIIYGIMAIVIYGYRPGLDLYAGRILLSWRRGLTAPVVVKPETWQAKTTTASPPPVAPPQPVTAPQIPARTCLPMSSRLLNLYFDQVYPEDFIDDGKPVNRSKPHLKCHSRADIKPGKFNPKHMDVRACQVCIPDGAKPIPR